MAPDFRFPEASDDVDSAIRWVKAHAAEYHVDSAKIALIGESAGGFLVNYAGTHETPETKVAAVVDFYGPVDYGKLAEERRDHPERFNMTSINRHACQRRRHPLLRREQLDAAGLAKLHAHLADLRGAQRHAAVPGIHGTKDDQVSYEQIARHVRRHAQGGRRVRPDHHRRRRPRHERLEGAGDAALEARDVAWLKKTLQIK